MSALARQFRPSTRRFVAVQATRCPISALPDELLDMVFLFLAEEQVCYQNALYKAVAVDVVPLVCRRWFRLATGRPCLWTTILFHDTSSLVNLWQRLRLSGGQLLHVDIRQFYPGYQNTLHEYLECARILVDVTPLIKTFKISGFSAAPLAEILRVFSLPAPRLRELRVKATDDFLPPDNWPLLFGADMPRLWKATISQSVVDLRSFRDVQGLRLFDQGHLPFYTLMRVLEELQSLRCLVIKMKRYSEWDNAVGMYEGTIALPMLDKLCIVGCQDNVLRILGPLEFSPDAEVHITIFSDNTLVGRHRQGCAYLRQFTRNLQAVNLAYYGEVSNCMLTRSIAITSMDKKANIRWIWSNAENASAQGQPGIFFDMVVDLREVIQVNVVQLPTVFLVHRSEWRRLLDLVPGLEVLEVHIDARSQPDGTPFAWHGSGAEMPYDDILAHFSSLCAELEAADEEGHWLCPRLRLVSSPYPWILLRQTAEAYVPCIRNRVAAGGPMTLLGHGDNHVTIDDLSRM